MSAKDSGALGLYPGDSCFVVVKGLETYLGTKCTGCCTGILLPVAASDKNRIASC